MLYLLVEVQAGLGAVLFLAVMALELFLNLAGLSALLLGTAVELAIEFLDLVRAAADLVLQRLVDDGPFPEFEHVVEFGVVGGAL